MKNLISKIKHISFWIFINGLFMGSGIAGLFFKIKWSENIFLFFLWVFFLLSIAPMVDIKTRLELKAKGRAMNKWIEVTYDIIIICMLASAGRFISAFAWTLQLFFHENTHSSEGLKNDNKR